MTADARNPLTAEQIAAAFRQGRLSATALAAYPGDVTPATLAAAYHIQNVALAAWPGPVGGWKVAAVQPQWREQFPAERLVGPVLASNVWQTDSAQVPVVEGGYAAVEVEFAIRIAKPVPVGMHFERPAEIGDYVGGVHAAIELAGSPLKNLSPLGPGAVISDFGNNAGLVVGDELKDFFSQPLENWTTRISINGQEAGAGDAARIPGGPVSALLFLINTLADRRIALKAGDWISTGASTGIHPVAVGDTFEAHFANAARISGRIVGATPQPA